jgi:hypothetical protein
MVILRLVESVVVVTVARMHRAVDECAIVRLGYRHVPSDKQALCKSMVGDEQQGVARQQRGQQGVDENTK